MDNEYAPDAFSELAEVLQSQPVDVALGQVDMMGLLHDPETGTLDYDKPRDYAKCTRFDGKTARLFTVDLMQAVIRRSVWRRYGFVGRDPSADGRLIERIANERGFAALPVFIGRHF